MDRVARESLFPRGLRFYPGSIISQLFHYHLGDGQPVLIGSEDIDWINLARDSSDESSGFVKGETFSH